LEEKADMQEKNIKLLPPMIATGMLSFAGVLIETAMNVTFPTLINEFGITTGQVQWVTTIYLLVISIFVPFSNYLLKTMSIRKLFVIANIISWAFFTRDEYGDCVTINVLYYINV
jgi:MFS family permease